MAALTQHRPAHRKHAGLIGAMRIVAIAAVFSDWCMFPKKRSAFFGVAVETGVIDRLLDKLQVGCCAVSTVAAAAIHLALANGMRVGFQGLGALLPVTVEADFRLC